MAGSAGVAVEDGTHSGLASLTDDLRSKVHLVMWRANARRDLHYQVTRIGAELLFHRRNYTFHYAKLRPFFPCVNEADRSRFLINEINSCTVGDVDAETKLRA